MPMTSASSPVTLRKMMRRLRLENVTRTNRYQPCSSRAASRRRAFLSAVSFSPGRFGSTSVAKVSGVRLSTVVGLPVARPHSRRRRRSWAIKSLSDQVLGRSSSWTIPALRRQVFGVRSLDSAATPRPLLTLHLLEPITDAIQRFDHVEVVVGPLKLLAQALDMTVDGAVIDVNLIVVGGIHQRIAALDHAGPARQRLQDQELGDGQRDRLVLPGAGMALRVHAQQAALQHLGGVGLFRGGAILGRRTTQDRLDPLDQE